MPVSEEGFQTGSIDVSKLDETEATSDEAKAQLEQLKADRDAGLEGAPEDDNRDAQGKPVADDDEAADDDDKSGEAKAEEKPAEAKSQSSSQAPGTVQPPAAKKAEGKG